MQTIGQRVVNGVHRRVIDQFFITAIGARDVGLFREVPGFLQVAAGNGDGFAVTSLLQRRYDAPKANAGSAQNVLVVMVVCSADVCNAANQS